MRSGASRFVVRATGRWWLCDEPGAVPVEASLGEVLSAISSASNAPLVAGEPGAGRRVHRVLATDRISLRPLMVAGIVRGGVVIEDSRGGTVLLAEIQLRLLDCMIDDISVEDLARRAGLTVEQAVDAARVLASAGLVRVDAASLTDVHESVTHQQSPQFVSATPAPGGRAPAPVHFRIRDHAVARLRTAWRLSSKAGRLRAMLRATPPRPGVAPERSPEMSLEPGPELPPTSRIIEPAPRPADVVPADRIPVYAVWHPGVGMPLALGMLTAFARTYGDGRLAERYEIHRPEEVSVIEAELAARSGPAVLLCSDYLWTIEANLDFARTAKAAYPSLVVVHGGPSAPKYESDAEEFLRRHSDAVDVLVRGEGEMTLARFLDAAAEALPTLDPTALGEVAGLSFLDAEATFVRTPDADRIVDLDILPSPYLSGEFDDVPFEQWGMVIPIETNRGCPYRCTFCDWGSAIASRVRSFDLERVRAEIEWVARTARTIYIADANFGMMPRDRAIASMLADVRARTGEPRAVYFTTSKKSTAHLVEILDTLTEAGIATDTSLSLQSTDVAALAAVDRRNISTKHYLELARQFRLRGQPPVAEFMLGLPGQTLGGYRGDLQFAFDHGLQARTWETRVLPNSPMNDPEYRDLWRIVTVPRGPTEVVISTSTFTSSERDAMLRLRFVAAVTDRLGVARHVWRYLQWDHGIEATEAMSRLLERAEHDPAAYPNLTWLITNFKRFPAPPVGWTAVYAELRRFVSVEFGVAPSTAFDTVMRVQEFIMPRPGRSLPEEITLAHDYVAYYRDATKPLYETIGPAVALRPLDSYPPATFAVDADPLGLCEHGIWFDPEQMVSGEDHDSDDFYVGTRTANELMSAIAQPSLTGLAVGLRITRDDVDVDALGPVPVDDAEREPDEMLLPEIDPGPIRISIRTAHPGGEG